MLKAANEKIKQGATLAKIKRDLQTITKAFEAKNDETASKIINDLWNK